MVSARVVAVSWLCAVCGGCNPQPNYGQDLGNSTGSGTSGSSSTASTSSSSSPSSSTWGDGSTEGEADEGEADEGQVTGFVPDAMNCVARGSLVATPEGQRPVEKLELGDEVWCVDPNTGERFAARVTNITVSRRELLGMQVEGGAQLRLTADHPVYSPAHDSYAHAGHWRSGELDEVAVWREGKLETAKVQQCLPLDEVDDVFDITVDHPLHNLLADAVLVHNKTCGVECDIWGESECPEGEKCTAVTCEVGGNKWDSNVCREISGDMQLGDACIYVDGEPLFGRDDCAEGLMCWNVDTDTGMGSCVAFCTGSPDEPQCPDARVCMIANDGVLPICLESCDPLDSQCAEGELCISVEDGPFACTPDASGEGGQVGTPCWRSNSCKPGLACIEEEFFSEAGCGNSSGACCSPYCDLEMPAACPETTQTCQPFFEDPDTAPPGFDHVGICRI